MKTESKMRELNNFALKSREENKPCQRAQVNELGLRAMTDLCNQAS